MPRALHFVEETKNRTVIQAGGTIKVNPRRGTQDKAPWKELDLTGITGQTIETAHFYDVHHGETLVPYATLDPLKAVLPLRRGDRMLAKDSTAVGGIKADGLENRMRERWRTVSRLWEENKPAANRLSMLRQLDYYGKLTAQIEWQLDNGQMPVRVIYGASGVPTAAIVDDAAALIDYTGFWVACANYEEANYLLSIINSDVLYAEIKPLMAKGQFGARHVQKHPWKLPIPRYDDGEALHRELAEAGKAAAEAVQGVLADLRAERGDKVSVTIARREIRKWLRESDEGKTVERLVEELLG